MGHRGHPMGRHEHAVGSRWHHMGIPWVPHGTSRIISRLSRGTSHRNPVGHPMGKFDALWASHGHPIGHPMRHPVSE